MGIPTARPDRPVHPTLALVGLLALCVGAASLGRDRLVERLPSIVQQQFGAFERRLGVRMSAEEVTLDGWRTLGLSRFVVRPSARIERPLLAASKLYVELGISFSGFRPRVVPEAIRVEGASVRVGGDLLQILESEGTGRRQRQALRLARQEGARADDAGGPAVPRIDVVDASLLVERPNGTAERWGLPRVTLASVGEGRLSGRAELVGAGGMPPVLALSGRVSEDGVSLQVEAPTPLRPTVMAEWLGRSVGFRAMQVDGAGLTLREVEVSVPSAQGVEIMARLPTLRVRLPGGEVPRVELARAWMRIERYADGRHNLMDLLGVGRWNRAKVTPSAGGEQESVHLVRRPALRMSRGDITLVNHVEGAPPTSVGLRRMNLRLSPTEDGYDARATWSPAKGAGVLSADGRLVDEEDFDVRLDFETLDLRELSFEGPARLVAGRADGGIHLRGRGDQVRATGQVRLAELAALWPLLARETVEGVDLVADVDATWNRSNGEVRLANLAATLAGTEMTAWGVLAHAGRPEAYDLNVVMGPAPCDDIVRSIPAALRPQLGDLRLDGHVTLRVRLRGRRDDPDSLRLTVDSDMEGFSVRSGGPDMARLARPFEHSVRLGQGVEGGRVVKLDPSAKSYTAYEDTPVFLRSAIVASEDVAFWRHQGFDLRQIGASLARNLESGRIERGGSTVSQQLVKNLFLGGEKTLARKLQEAFLTWRMEEELPKRRILEIYMNVVEWGPGIYGVREAAWHYFKKRPKHLSLRQSAFLAAILPNPVRLGRSNPGGRVSPLVRGRMDRVIRRRQLLGYVSKHAGVGAPRLRLRTSG